MSKHVTSDLFKAIKQLLPGLPENVTQLDLIMRMDAVPIVICKFQVRGDSGTIRDEQKTFLVVEHIEQSHAPITTPASAE